MADNKKPLLSYWLEKSSNKKEAKELEAGGKENLPHVLDLLDIQTGARKVLPGPSIEELQESQLKSMMDPDYKRPASHVAKDVTTTLAPAIIAGLSKAVSKPVIKHAAEKTTGKVTSNILDKASKGTGKITNYELASKEGNPDLVKYAKSASRLNNESKKAYNKFRSMTYGKYDDAIKGLTEVTKGKKLTKEEFEKLKKTVDLLEYQRDLDASKVKLDLYDILREEFGLPNITYADGTGSYDLNIDKDLFEVALRDPDKVRKLINRKDLMDEIAKANPEKTDLTKLFNKAKDKTWDVTHRKLIKDLNKNNKDSLVNALRSLSVEGINDPDLIDRVIEKGRMPNEKESARIKAALIKSAQSNSKGYSLFEKIMNPKDPLYKYLIENSTEILNSNNALIEYVRKGQPFEEAVQNYLVDFIFNTADEDYVNALYSVAKGGNASSPDFKDILRKHPFRNKDGSIKSEGEIIKAIGKDPFYEEIVKGFIDKELRVPLRSALYSEAKSKELSSLPLLASHITRLMKDASNNATAYDPYSRGSVLPPEYAPWDPKLESTYTDRFFRNIGDVLGINWQDPSRFTSEQKDIVRTALETVAKDTGFASPAQIRSLSELELLSLLDKVGDLEYGRDVAKKVSAIANNMMANADSEREARLAELRQENNK